MYRRPLANLTRRAYATGPLPGTPGAGAAGPKKPDNTPIIIGIVAAVGLGAYFLSGSGEKKVDKLEKQAQSALGK